MTQNPSACHPVWEQIFRTKRWGQYPPEHVVRGVARNFFSNPDRRAVKLLEIGCGPGANVWFMAREGFSVAGIDGSPSAIQQAQKRLEREGLSADLRVGDYTNSLPWDNNTFDGVVENVSLYCNPCAAIQHAVGEVRRVLKAGGTFLSCFFTDRTWGYGLGTKVELDGFIDITEGPIAGTGFALFLTRTRVDELFAPFTDVQVERISWTLGSERHLIEQFVIACRKPAE